MNKGSKKFFVIGIIAVVIAVCLFLYLKPMPLSELASENQDIVIVWNKPVFEGEKARIDSKSYERINDEQKVELVKGLGEYSYRRTIGTAFSDGTLSDFNEVLYLYIYENNDLICEIHISDKGAITINQKNYHMKNAPELINELLKIVKE